MADRLRRIGVLTGGGDCPGLNAVLRAIVKTAAFDHGIDVVGIEDGYAGLIQDRMRPLEPSDVGGILARGGTILGSSNRDNPFRVPVDGEGDPAYRDRSTQCLKNASRHGLDLLIVIGGDGSLSIANDLKGRGLPIIGVPKTIDNDLAATDLTFGFDSALEVATEAVDRLHTTAMSHHRVMVLEVMGRYAGWIALEAGIAGGGDVILIPEIPFELPHVAAAIRERWFRGRTFAIVVGAEGAAPVGGDRVVASTVADSTDPIRLGGIGTWLADQLGKHLDMETRATVLGHLQRGGVPTAFDRILGTRYGVHAVQAAVAGERDVMVCLRGRNIETAPLEEAVRELRRVDPQGALVNAARSVGTSFGDRAPR
ncbi:MAG: ATP-dependent 6-phosphofructokinase [Candidatus Eisenbacteria bacterium]|nr:ATP-dependent 6-phosphofructokinase [Candidatus Latescibacterota bacterium]MBD3301775.1 ATP-dependent 6-phosphofructokinase [Candidatus Eisenbacteria bacterium]